MKKICRYSLSVLILVTLLLSLIPIPTGYVSANPSFTARVETQTYLTAMTTPFDGSVSKPTGTTAGDILFCGISAYRAGYNLEVDSVPSGWILITSVTSRTGQEYWLYYKIAGASEPSSYTWSFDDGTSWKVLLVCSAYTGGDFNSDDPIDAYSTVEYVVSDSTVRASMTTGHTNCPLVFWAMRTNASCTFTKPSVPTSDWVEDYDYNAGTYLCTEVCSMVWTGSGATGNIDATASDTSTNKHGFAVALNPPAAPTVTNLPATDITNVAATLNGNLTANGGASTTVHIYWGDNDGVTNSSNWDHDIDKGVLSVGTFDSDITSLTTNTTYYFRCYAVNGAGSDWADTTENFTTLLTYDPPTVESYAATNVLYWTATLSGGITYTGGDNPNTRGFQWGTSPGSYTLSWNETGDFGVGNFSHDVTGLADNTTYYFRAFAVNDNGAGNGTELNFTTLAAVSLGYSFHQIDPPAQITIPVNDAWTDIDANTYGVPAGATGIFYIIKNWEGSGGEDCPFGVRKNGSTDNRINPLWEHTPSWGAIGIDFDGIFEIYKGSITTSFGFWIMGYTTDGVTFLTNGIDKSATLSGWRDIDCSAEAPNAIGLIFEVVGPSRGEIMVDFGFRNNGSTDTFDYNAPDHCAPAIMIGCDANQITEGYVAYTTTYDFYLIGYVTDGAYFYTNGVYQGPDTPSAWTDLPTALPDSVMGFYEFRGSGSAYGHDLRKNGTSWSYGGLDNRHCWAWAGCDGSGIVEGYVADVSIDYYLVGYATESTQYILTDPAEDIAYTSADLQGTIVDTNGETIGTRGFEYGLTQTATWNIYETGSTTVSYGHSSDNYLDATNTRRGQHVTLSDMYLTSMSFRLHKIASPTGDVTFGVRNVSGDALVWSEVLCDASALETSFTWYTIDFDSPVYVNSDVHLYVEFTNGNSTDKVNTGYYDADVGDGVYARYQSGWYDVSATREMEIKYVYESSGNFGSGSYSLTATSLADNTGHWFRAYMVGNVTSYYGDWIYFETLEYVAPTVTSSAATGIIYTGATLHGLITSNGGYSVTFVGFEWDTNTGAPYAHSWNTSYSTDAFSHAFTDMPDDTTIYWRAFAVNDIGTGYSGELSFATLPYVVPTLTLSEITGNGTLAVFSGTVTDIGGLTVTERGFQWGYSTGSYTGNWSQNGTFGIGSFSDEVTDLEQMSAVYWRAYAVNSVGTGYSVESSFNTGIASLDWIPAALVAGLFGLVLLVLVLWALFGKVPEV